MASLILMAASSVGLLRFFNPPFTSFMIWESNFFEKKVDYRWTSIGNMGENIILSVIATEDKILFKKPTSFAKPIALIKKGRLLIVQKCENNWCEIETDDFNGWIKNDDLWGLIKISR